jgi:hypothetical protein
VRGAPDAAWQPAHLRELAAMQLLQDRAGLPRINTKSIRGTRASSRAHSSASIPYLGSGTGIAAGLTGGSGRRTLSQALDLDSLHLSPISSAAREYQCVEFGAPQLVNGSFEVPMVLTQTVVGAWHAGSRGCWLGLPAAAGLPAAGAGGAVAGRAGSGVLCCGAGVVAGSPADRGLFARAGPLAAVSQQARAAAVPEGSEGSEGSEGEVLDSPTAFMEACDKVRGQPPCWSSWHLPAPAPQPRPRPRPATPAALTSPRPHPPPLPPRRCTAEAAGARAAGAGAAAGPAAAAARAEAAAGGCCRLASQRGQRAVRGGGREAERERV